MDYYDSAQQGSAGADPPEQEISQNIASAPASSPPPVLVQLGLVADSTLREMREDQLLAALASGEWPVRVAALRRLEELGGCTSTGPLVIALGDEERMVRVAAAQALGACGEHAPIDPLISALHDPEWPVRAAAAEALGKCGARAPLGPLLEALQDEDEEVRATAAWSLGELGERVPLAPLLAALCDPSWSVREAVAQALGKLGARVPLAPLLECRTDEDEAVRAAIEFALEQMYSADRAAPVRTEPLALEERKHAEALPSEQRSLAWTEPVTDSAPVRTPDPQRSLFTSEWRSTGYGQGQSRSIERTHRRKRVQDRRMERSSGPVVAQRAGNFAPKGHSRLTHTLERGLVAAVIIGIALAWLLLGQELRTSTSSQKHISTLFSYTDPAGAVDRVAWSTPEAGQGDTVLIAFADASGLVQVWDPAANRRIASYGPFPKVLALGWAVDGNLHIAALRRDGTIALIRGGESAPFMTIPASPGNAPVAAWSPDGESIAVASVTGDGSRVQIWDTVSRKVTATHSSQFGAVRIIAWPTSGKIMATASDDGNATQIEMWAADTGKSFIPPVPIPYTAVAFHVIAMAWSPNGQNLAYILDDGEVRLGNKSGAIDSQLSSSDPHAYWSRNKSWAAALAWSPDGRRLASTTASGLVLVWDVGSGNQLYSYNGHAGQINDLAWSRDGKWIVSGGADGKVQVWGNS